MTIDITEKTRVAVGWYLPGDRQDLLAVVFKQEGEPWMCRYRFRYYSPTSEDRKSWYTIKAKADPHSDAARDKLIEAIDLIVEQTLAAGYVPEGKTHYRVVIDGGPQEFYDKWLSLPFNHQKQERT